MRTLIKLYKQKNIEELFDVNYYDMNECGNDCNNVTQCACDKLMTSDYMANIDTIDTLGLF